MRRELARTPLPESAGVVVVARGLARLRGDVLVRRQQGSRVHFGKPGANSGLVGRCMLCFWVGGGLRGAHTTTTRARRARAAKLARTQA